MLDDILRRILDDRQYQDPTKQWYDDVIDENIEAIKKAFADAGYVDMTKPPVDNVHGVRVVEASLMTGQEWLARFKKETALIVPHRISDAHDLYSGSPQHSRGFKVGFNLAKAQLLQAARRAARELDGRD